MRAETVGDDQEVTGLHDDSLRNLIAGGLAVQGALRDASGDDPLGLQPKSVEGNWVPSCPLVETAARLPDRTIDAREAVDIIPEFDRVTWLRVKQDDARRKAYHRKRHAARQNARRKREVAAK